MKEYWENKNKKTTIQEDRRAKAAKRHAELKEKNKRFFESCKKKKKDQGS